MKNDRFFLLRAVGIAAEGIKEGGGPFGAVITSGNEIIAESNNKVVLSHDPTAHAEMIVIRKASGFLKIIILIPDHDKFPDKFRGNNKYITNVEIL